MITDPIIWAKAYKVKKQRCMEFINFVLRQRIEPSYLEVQGIFIFNATDSIVIIQEKGRGCANTFVHGRIDNAARICSYKEKGSKSLNSDAMQNQNESPVMNKSKE